MRQKEGQLDDKIRKYCKDNKLYYLKTNGGGNPDCIICVRGRFLSMETKVDDNDMSTLQCAIQSDIRNCDGICEEIRTFKDAVDLIIKVQKGS